METTRNIRNLAEKCIHFMQEGLRDEFGVEIVTGVELEFRAIPHPPSKERLGRYCKYMSILEKEVSEIGKDPHHPKREDLKVLIGISLALATEVDFWSNNYEESDLPEKDQDELYDYGITRITEPVGPNADDVAREYAEHLLLNTRSDHFSQMAKELITLLDRSTISNKDFPNSYRSWFVENSSEEGWVTEDPSVDMTPHPKLLIYARNLAILVLESTNKVAEDLQRYEYKLWREKISPEKTERDSKFIEATLDIREKFETLKDFGECMNFLNEKREEYGETEYQGFSLSIIGRFIKLLNDVENHYDRVEILKENREFFNENDFRELFFKSWHTHILSERDISAQKLNGILRRSLVSRSEALLQSSTNEEFNFHHKRVGIAECLLHVSREICGVHDGYVTEIRGPRVLDAEKLQTDFKSPPHDSLKPSRVTRFYHDYSGNQTYELVRGHEESGDPVATARFVESAKQMVVREAAEYGLKGAEVSTLHKDARDRISIYDTHISLSIRDSDGVSLMKGTRADPDKFSRYLLGSKAISSIGCDALFLFTPSNEEIERFMLINGRTFKNGIGKEELQERPLKLRAYGYKRGVIALRNGYEMHRNRDDQTDDELYVEYRMVGSGVNATMAMLGVIYSAYQSVTAQIADKSYDVEDASNTMSLNSQQYIFDLFCDPNNPLGGVLNDLGSKYGNEGDASIGSDLIAAIKAQAIKANPELSPELSKHLPHKNNVNALRR